MGSVKHTYTLDGDKILREVWGSNTLVPLYDNEDKVCGIIYNGTPYYFQKNLQGDVIGIVDKDAKVVAKYSYDAWGVCTITHDASGCSIATVNPFRYRGYYFDTEIGMYYLQSRYYDPVIGRFINADDPKYVNAAERTVQHCLYSYCENDAVNKTDDTGSATVTVIGVGLQIELCLWNVIVGGVEFIWYYSPYIRKGKALYEPYVYFYGGVSGNVTSLVSKLIKSPTSISQIPQPGFGASASISVFAVFGLNGKFTGPKDYEKWFTGASSTVWNVKGYSSWSDKCVTVGVGLDSSKFSASVSKSYYQLSSTMWNNAKNFYNTVSNKGKNIKYKK